MAVRRVTDMVLGRVGSVLVDVVYPARCAGCGRRGCWVCRDCDAALGRFAPPWCEGCGTPTGLGDCVCSSLPRSLSGLRSVGRYEGWLRHAIVRFKYEEEWARADHLSAALAETLRTWCDLDALVPVPLHPERQGRRGYNQSALLAKGAGKLLAMPVLRALQRIRATPHQVGLRAEERRRNVQDAFAVSSGANLVGKRLVLVDDVTTTGSTLGACPEALLAGGACEVRAVTLARET